QAKKITVTMDADERVYLRMDPLLADLLFDNLIGNALKHNHENGFIHIAVLPNQITISNSGEPLQVPAEKLFDRFVKNNAASDSLGLGLSMVKQICLNYNFGISYTSEGTSHTISLSF